MRVGFYFLATREGAAQVLRDGSERRLPFYCLSSLIVTFDTIPAKTEESACTGKRV